MKHSLSLWPNGRLAYRVIDRSETRPVLILVTSVRPYKEHQIWKFEGGSGFYFKGTHCTVQRNTPHTAVVTVKKQGVDLILWLVGYSREQRAEQQSTAQRTAYDIIGIRVEFKTLLSISRIYLLLTRYSDSLLSTLLPVRWLIYLSLSVAASISISCENGIYPQCSSSFGCFKCRCILE